MRIKIAAANISWHVDPNYESLEALLKGPEIRGMWHNALDIMAEKANELAAEHGHEDAVYDTAVHEQGNMWGFEPGGYIYTANYKARVDMKYYHTLLHVQAMAPSLIAAAGRMDLGNGLTYEPKGRGSKVQGEGGRFVSQPDIKEAKNPWDSNLYRKDEDE